MPLLFAQNQKARSILCMPMSNQGRAAGTLYLENGAIPGLFTAARGLFVMVRRG